MSGTAHHDEPATAGADPPVLRFVRLTHVDPAAVLALLNEPRNARHLPLAGAVDAGQAASWVEAKDAQWEEHGYGPWAILLDGTFAGWGGFQAEADGADFALVLSPPYWGHGAAVTDAALEIGFTSLGLDGVTIALPQSRNPDRVVGRLGFLPDGWADHGGTRFRRYRLTRDRWAAGRRA